MTSLHVIFGLAPSQSKILATPMHRGGGGGGEGAAFWDVPPKFTACVPQARVNFSTSTRGPAYFCAKTGHHERFSMKQQNRSRERDQVV